MTMPTSAALRQGATRGPQAPRLAIGVGYGQPAEALQGVTFQELGGRVASTGSPHARALLLGRGESGSIAIRGSPVAWESASQTPSSGRRLATEVTGWFFSRWRLCRLAGCRLLALSPFSGRGDGSWSLLPAPAARESASQTPSSGRRFSSPQEAAHGHTPWAAS